MAQTKIDLPESSPTTKIYYAVNSPEYATEIKKANEGNKSANRRVRKQLLIIEKLCKRGRKELLKNG